MISGRKEKKDFVARNAPRYMCKPQITRHITEHKVDRKMWELTLLFSVASMLENISISRIDLLLDMYLLNLNIS